jgi:hypothetical protein
MVPPPKVPHNTWVAAHGPSSRKSPQFPDDAVRTDLRAILPLRCPTDDYGSTMLAAVNRSRCKRGALARSRLPALEATLRAAFGRQLVGEMRARTAIRPMPLRRASHGVPADLAIDHSFLLGPRTLLSYNDLSAAWEALIRTRPNHRSPPEATRTARASGHPQSPHSSQALHRCSPPVRGSRRSPRLPVPLQLQSDLKLRSGLPPGDLEEIRNLPGYCVRFPGRGEMLVGHGLIEEEAMLDEPAVLI